MPIKWTFVFGDKHFIADINSEEEDLRIENAVEEGNKLLYIDGEQEAYLNLALCSAIFRVEEKEGNFWALDEVTG